MSVIKLKPVREKIKAKRDGEDKEFLIEFIPYMIDLIVNLNAKYETSVQVRSLLTDEKRQFIYNDHEKRSNLKYNHDAETLASEVVSRLRYVFPNIQIIDRDKHGFKAISWDECE